MTENAAMPAPPPRQAGTDKLLALNHRFHSGYQLTSRMCFNNVASCAQAESFSHHIGRRFLTQEYYVGFRGQLANSPSGFDSVQFWQTDIEQYQIRSQFFSLSNRF